MLREDIEDEILHAVRNEKLGLRKIEAQLYSNSSTSITEADHLYISKTFLSFLIDCVLDLFENLFIQQIRKKKNQVFINYFMQKSQEFGSIEDLQFIYGEDDNASCPIQLTQLVTQAKLLDENETRIVIAKVCSLFWTTLLSTSKNAEVENEVLSNLIDCFKTNCALEIHEQLENFSRLSNRPERATFLKEEFKFERITGRPVPLRKFLRSLDRLEEGELMFKQKFVIAIEAFVEKVQISIKEFQNHKILQISGGTYRLQDHFEILQKILVTNRAIIDGVHINANYSLCIDVNLENEYWYGMNIVIVAQHIFIECPCSWDISGKSSEIYYEPAANGKSPGDDGTDGKHGQPGESGGNFTIITDTFENPELLTVISNGGNGSSGQNGGNGMNGRNGEYWTIDQLCSKFPPLNFFDGASAVRNGIIKKIESCASENRCIIKWVHPNIFTNRYYEIELSNGQKIIFSFSKYFVYNLFIVVRGSNGQEGGKGGKNGIRGQGGFHGDCIATNFRDTKKFGIRTTINTGNDGSDGIPGLNGEYGKNACDVGYRDYDWWSNKREFSQTRNEKISIDYSSNSDGRVYCAYAYDYNNSRRCYVEFSGKTIEQKLLKENQRRREPTKEKPQETQAKRKNALLRKEIISAYKKKLNQKTSVQQEIFTNYTDLAQEQLEKLQNEIEKLKSKTSEKVHRYQVYDDSLRKYEIYREPIKPVVIGKDVIEKISKKPSSLESWMEIFNVEMTKSEMKTLENIFHQVSLDDSSLALFKLKKSLVYLQESDIQTFITLEARKILLDQPKLLAKFLIPDENSDIQVNLSPESHEIEEMFQELRNLCVNKQILSELNEKLSRLFSFRLDGMISIGEMIEHLHNEEDADYLQEFSKISKSKKFIAVSDEAKQFIQKHRPLSKIFDHPNDNTHQNKELKLLYELTKIQDTYQECIHANSVFQTILVKFLQEASEDSNFKEELLNVQQFHCIELEKYRRLRSFEQAIENLNYNTTLPIGFTSYDDSFQPNDKASEKDTDQNLHNRLRQKTLIFRRALVKEFNRIADMDIVGIFFEKHSVEPETLKSCLTYMKTKKVESSALRELVAYNSGACLRLYLQDTSGNLDFLEELQENNKEKYLRIDKDSSSLLKLDENLVQVYLSRMSFVQEMEQKLKQTLLLNEDDALYKILKFFGEDEQDEIEQVLSKISSTYLGKNSILEALRIVFETNGNHLDYRQIVILVEIVIECLVLLGLNLNYFAYTILKTPQAHLIDSFILVLYENRAKKLSQDSKTILANLRSISDERLKINLLQKISNSAEMPTEEKFLSILKLLKFYENQNISHFLDLELNDWADALKDGYWKERINLSQLKNMPDINHCSFYFVRLSSIYGDSLTEELLLAVETWSNLEHKTILKFMYRLYSEEIELNKNLVSDMFDFSTFIISRGRKVDEIIENASKLEKPTVQSLASKLGLLEEKERKIGKLIKMLKKESNEEQNCWLEEVERLIELDLSDEIKKVKEETLQKLIDIAKNDLEKRCQKEDEDKHAFLLKVVNYAIFYKRGYELRDTQKFIILATLKNQRGLLSQVATGEGKTLIIMSIAIIKCLMGEKVDIITSSSVLAKRDAESRPPKGNLDIYELFGIQVGHNCMEELDQRTVVYNNCDVVYGDLANFQRDYLLDTFYGKNILGSRTRLNAIVDEVDSMLLDNGNNMLYLSHDIPGMDHLQSLFVFIWKCVNSPMKGEQEIAQQFDNSWIVRAILRDLYGVILQNEVSSVTWKKLVESEIIGNDGRIKKVCHDYRKIVKEIKLEDESEEEKTIFLLNSNKNRRREIHIPHYLIKYVDIHMEHFIDSAKSALFMQPGVDYVIDVDRSSQDNDMHPKIIIIDRNTGTDQLTSQWHNGLHQFLQLKHGCKLTMMGLKAVFISNVSYFLMYTNIYGLSGTLGSLKEKQLLSNLYNVNLIKLPTWKPKKFYEEQPIIVRDQGQWIDAIYQEINKKMYEKRSVLVIGETVKDVEFLSKQLVEKADIKMHKFYNNIVTYKRDYEEFQLADGNDCLPCNKIIIATNLAGRGTDIKLSEELIKTGGLHVMVTFLPDNTRVEEQAFGRAARCGEPGSGQLIIMDYRVKQEKSTTSKIFDLKNIRDADELIRLESIVKHYEEKIKIEEKCFNQFQRKYQKIKQRLEQLDCKENRMNTILNSSLDTWAFWLDEHAKYIDENSESNQEKLFHNLKEFMETLSADLGTWNYNPMRFLKQATNLIDENNYKQARKWLDYIVTQDPYFEPEALYYKTFIHIKENGSSLTNSMKKEYIELSTMVRKAKVLFEDRIDRCRNDQGFVESFKNHQSGLILVEAFIEQQKNLIRIYETFINSINGLVGHPVQYGAFSSLDVNEILSKDLFLHFQEKGVIQSMKVSKIQTEFYQDFRNIAEDYGFHREDLIKVIEYKSGEKIQSDDFMKHIHLPNLEEFWDILIIKKVLQNVQTIYEVDTSKFSMLDPSVVTILENLINENLLTVDWKNLPFGRILKYPKRKEQIDTESKKFCKSELKSGLKNVANHQGKLEEYLMTHGIININNIADVNKNGLKNDIHFEKFSSITLEDLVYVGIEAKEARNILDILVESKVLAKKEKSASSEKKSKLGSFFGAIFDQLGEGGELEKVHECYREVVKALIHMKLVYSSIYRQMQESFKDETAKDEKNAFIGNFNIPLTSNPYQSLIFELVDRGIVTLPSINQTNYPTNTDLNDLINNFSSNFYSISSNKSTLNDQKQTESIGQILKTLGSTLLQLETPDCEFTDLLESMRQHAGNSTSEVAWFTMNGFDRVISATEKKYSMKFWINLLIITTLALTQIIIGAVIEIFTVGAGTFLASGFINEGISDLFFVASSLLTGYCTMSDYWQHKKISLAITVVSFGFAALLSRGVKVSRLGYKVVGPAKEVAGKKVVEMAGKSLIKEISMKTVIKETTKRVGLKILEGASYGMAQAGVEYAIRNHLTSVCETIQSTIRSKIDDAFNQHLLSSTLLEAYENLGEEKTNKLVTKVSQTCFEKEEFLLKKYFTRIVSIALRAFGECSRKLSKVGKTVPFAKIASMLSEIQGAMTATTVTKELVGIANESTTFLDKAENIIRDEIDENQQTSSPTERQKEQYRILKDQHMEKWRKHAHERSTQAIAQQVVAPILSQGANALVGYVGRTIKKEYRKSQDEGLKREMDQAKKDFERKTKFKNLEKEEFEQIQKDYHKTLVNLMSKTRSPELFGAIIREGIPLDVTSMQACSHILHKCLQGISGKFTGIEIIVEEPGDVQHTYKSSENATHTIILSLEDNHFTFNGKSIEGSSINSCLFDVLAAAYPPLLDTFADDQSFREHLSNIIQSDDQMKFIIEKGWHRHAITKGSFGGAESKRYEPEDRLEHHTNVLTKKAVRLAELFPNNEALRRKIAQKIQQCIDNIEKERKNTENGPKYIEEEIRKITDGFDEWMASERANMTTQEQNLYKEAILDVRHSVRDYGDSISKEYNQRFKKLENRYKKVDERLEQNPQTKDTSIVHPGRRENLRTVDDLVVERDRRGRMQLRDDPDIVAHVISSTLQKELTKNLPPERRQKAEKEFKNFNSVAVGIYNNSLYVAFNVENPSAEGNQYVMSKEAHETILKTLQDKGMLDGRVQVHFLKTKMDPTTRDECR
uniref:Chloroplast protein-transporting ATPase n=1 Tax=Acrobeloides nanus TaxID=290746 RepID=A0A914DZB2_9BILA